MATEQWESQRTRTVDVQFRGGGITQKDLSFSRFPQDLRHSESLAREVFPDGNLER